MADVAVTEANDATVGVEPKDDLAKATVRGVGWTAGAQVGRQVLQIATSLIVARLLLPSDFGTVAQVTVIANVANILGDFGLGAALVQRTQVEERHASTVFWGQAILGFVVSLVVAACAPLIAAFYGDPELRMLTLVLAPSFFVTSLCVVQRSLLTRAMRFKVTAVADVAALAVSGIVCVVAAASGAGMYAIVAQILSSTLVVLVLLWAFARWRPSWTFDLDALRDLLPFSKNLLGYTFINYTIRNGDNLLVGRLMGASALGLYSRGYSILLYPTRQITSVVGRVMFASLSRVNDDVVRLRRGYLRAVAAISVLSFPLMAGVALVAGDLVPVLLGDQWLEAVTIIRIFAVLGIFESVTTSIGWIFQSTGRTDVLLRMSLYIGGAPLIGIAVGSLGGTVESVTIGYAVATTAMAYPALRIAGRLIGLRVRGMVAAVAQVGACTIGMSLAVGAVALMLPDGIAHLPALAAKASVGATTYLVLLHAFGVEAYLDLRARVLELRRSKSHGTTAPA